MTKIPSLALVSGRLVDQSDQHQARVDDTLSDYSDLLWSLWRLGVKHLVALPHDRSLLQRARAHLDPPPPMPRYQEPLLQELAGHQRQILRSDPLSQIAWSELMQITPPPTSPLQFDGVQLCFHDELIGVEDAFLIHYGPSRFEVSGYHSPMSSLSVPLGDELSALLLFRVSRSVAPTRPPQYPLIGSSSASRHGVREEPNETGVVQVNAKGILVKGPWWPKLKM